MSTVHELKTDPWVFQLSWDGNKGWEIRFDDRGYAVDDHLILRETKCSGEEMANGKPLEYTGRQIQARVTAVVEGYGLEKGWVILSVEIECRYASGVVITSSSEPVLLRINIGEEVESGTQEELKACTYYQTLIDAFGLLSRADIPKTSQDAIDTGNMHIILDECLGRTKSAISDIESGKIKDELYAGECMPEVGEVCEARFRHPGTDFSDWFGNAKFKGGYDSKIWFCCDVNEPFSKEMVLPAHDVEFRPIKSERESVVEAIEDILMKHTVSTKAVPVAAEALYDAGYRRMEGSNDE